jgi:tetratricopeptide (TPR) repeat protein/tRNA A-37 threonylcarbamoyl transferase component Bud32
MQCPRCGGKTATSSLCSDCQTSLTLELTRGVPAVTRASTVDGLTRAPDVESGAPIEAGAPPAASAEGPLAAGQSFGARYHIIRLLGAGGMGAVYHAWDAELGVSVAIKIIRPEVMADPRTADEVGRRFKRELLLARQVTHKNVVRIHDLGEIDGIKYITMSFVDGIDLATLLKQEGKLPVAKVMRLARAIVSGLVAAHAAGVVHRDLKPANIMISGADDDALIMDFGIARSSGSVEVAASVSELLPAHLRPDAEAVTVAAPETRGIVGTVEYMAPEQASGHEVDQRADIYSFGLILYDAILGRRRTTRTESPLDELRSRMKKAPPSARSVDASIPEAFDAVISRCLDPDPDKRYRTTSELEADLNRLDDDGLLIPVKRVVGVKTLAAVITLAVLIVGGSVWYAGTLAPDKPHDPVSVVIADLQNRTGDAAFDRTLEPLMMRAFQDAGFISAVDRNALRSTYGVRPPNVFDEAAASTIAGQQGLGIVLSGAVERQGDGYQVLLKVAQARTGNVISNVKARASDKNDVPGVAVKLMASVRKALGDRKSDSDPIFGKAALSTASLEVMRHYAAEQEAQSNGRFEEARQFALKMVELDPNFGTAYQLAAVASRSLGRIEEAKQYIAQALQHREKMTDREKLSTLGMSFRLSGDYQECVKQYGDLIKKYAGDVSGHNGVALCASLLRELQRARDEMQQIVDLVPNRTLFRINLGLYSDYAGDFKAAEAEASKVKEPNVMMRLVLAFAQEGNGDMNAAAVTYQGIANINTQGASLAASGLGDLASYQGRYADAVRILERGVELDRQANNPDTAAAKYAAIAYAELMRGQKAAAIAAADKAYANSKAVKIRFLAARIYIEAGDLARAKPLMESLAAELQSEPQAYAKLLEGGMALKSGNARQAIAAMDAGNKLLDTWIGDFDLGRAYFAAGAFLQAEAQFDRCVKRRGEALALFLDEEPTFAYFPAALAYQDKVRSAPTSSLQ